MEENHTLTTFPPGNLAKNKSEDYDNWTFAHLPSDLVKSEKDYNEEIVRMIQVIGGDTGECYLLILLNIYLFEPGLVSLAES